MLSNDLYWLHGINVALLFIAKYHKKVKTVRRTIHVYCFTLLLAGTTEVSPLCTRILEYGSILTRMQTVRKF